jgi:hypothetical protein
MPSVALGYGHYFAWHLPTLVLAVVASAVFVVIARQLARDAHGPAARSLRWSIVGWCAITVAFASAVTVPYLRAAAHWSRDRDGAWVFRNYLYIPVARIEASELREVRARDMGGVGFGTGHIEVRREDGRVVRSVRLDRDRWRAVMAAMGYGKQDVAQDYADAVIHAHRLHQRE